jgi:hypothetical protein
MGKILIRDLRMTRLCQLPNHSGAGKGAGRNVETVDGGDPGRGYRPDLPGNATGAALLVRVEKTPAIAYTGVVGVEIEREKV